MAVATPTKHRVSGRNILLFGALVLAPATVYFVVLSLAMVFSGGEGSSPPSGAFAIILFALGMFSASIIVAIVGAVRWLTATKLRGEQQVRRVAGITALGCSMTAAIVLTVTFVNSFGHTSDDYGHPMIGALTELVTVVAWVIGVVLVASVPSAASAPNLEERGAGRRHVVGRLPPKTRRAGRDSGLGADLPPFR